MAAPADFSQLAKALQSQGMGKPADKAGTINKATNLNHLVKTIRVLNRSDEDSTLSDTAFGANKAPTAKSYIMSDADAELLFLIEFREILDLESISFLAITPEKDDEDDDEEADYSAVRDVRVFVIDSLNKDFDDAHSAKPDLKVACSAKKLASAKGHVARTKKDAKASIKFGKVDKLMVLVASNQKDTEQTYISGMRFKGFSEAKTDMSRWDEVKKSG